MQHLSNFNKIEENSRETLKREKNFIVIIINRKEDHGKEGLMAVEVEVERDV